MCLSYTVVIGSCFAFSTSGHVVGTVTRAERIHWFWLKPSGPFHGVSLSLVGHRRGRFQHFVMRSHTVTNVFGQIPFCTSGCFGFAFPTGERAGQWLGSLAHCPVPSDNSKERVIPSCFPHCPANTIFKFLLTDYECVVGSWSHFNFHSFSQWHVSCADHSQFPKVQTLRVSSLTC